ncbi:MAG TPA: hypothetical protein VGW36_03285 [Pyrinomonadaceae bacterium]|nr:hypothetical protein [Pyrinomonadaceae bacterium]
MFYLGIRVRVRALGMRGLRKALNLVFAGLMVLNLHPSTAMNRFLLLFAILAFFPTGAGSSAGMSPPRVQSRVPIPDGLVVITQLPKELPQRISGLAYDGEKLWMTIYLGRGRYAMFDPSNDRWKVSERSEQHDAIKQVAGSFESPGSLCFAGDKLWIGGSYGDSFGSIDLQTWKVNRIFKGRYREGRGTQSYTGLVFDGTHLWIAWHWSKYNIPRSQTQLLLKIDPETGKVIQDFPLPAGTASDMTHGLAWDGKQLWHVKDQLLSAIDPSNGAVTAQYKLLLLNRPSGLAWDGKSLWITEFRGRIWRLPFQQETLARF